jgi:hypothetical protein
MSAELRDTRKAVFDRLTKSGFVPWLFEFTPASEESAEDAYLQKVNQCDVFVWITNGVTTEPVAAEVREALRARKDVLAFRLAQSSPDILTQELFKGVQKRHKTMDVHDERDLEEALEAALRDLSIRKLRAAPEATVGEALSALHWRSIARCYARFMAVGLDEATAKKLANDEEIGLQGALIAKTNGVLVVCDQLGAGKSLAADRAHQRAIGAARTGGPIPVWLAARDVRQSLEATIRLATKAIDDPRRRGAHVVVDGVDESDIDPWRLLDEARELVIAWPDTTVLITSRPVAGLQSPAELVRWAPLEDQEVLTLAALAGEAPSSLYLLAPALRDAVRRPLFALLLGGARRGQTAVAPHELVALLVDRALSRNANAVQSRSALTKLATLTTDRNGPVPIAEISEAEALAGTGLVQDDGRALSFGLAVVEQ